MFSKPMEDYEKIVLEENKKGNKTILLTKVGENFYELGMHTAWVRAIDDEPLENGMRRLMLAFENIDVDTIAYLDSDIIPGCFVKTIGYCYRYNNTTNYSCKAGIARIYKNIEQIKDLYRNKSYCMGTITALSRVSTKPYYNTNAGQIHQLGELNLYYSVEEKWDKNLKSFLNSLGKKQDEKMDTTSIPETEENQDYPLIEDETIKQEQQKNTKTLAENRFTDENGNMKQVSL